MAGTGFFLTVEGVDGVGKSTQVRILAERLRKASREVFTTREPGGTQGADDIRRLLVEGTPGRWSPDTEILLFTAARRDHVERVIGPALKRGAVVVCDRYVDSTRAYQGAGAPKRRKLIDQLHELAIRVNPDLTVILELEPEPALALARAEARVQGVLNLGSEPDRPHVHGSLDLGPSATLPRFGEHEQDADGTRFEQKGAKYQARIRAAFRAIAAAEPTRCVIIDATGAPEVVAERVWAAVAPRLRMTP